MAEEQFRDDVLMRLVDQGMSDEDFRKSAQRDLEGTLQAHGYELTDAELTAVREFHAEVASHSDEELQQAISNNAAAGRQGG